jgi:FtsP/CotA-like multicopper oxidase with cupredoxin domain
MTRRYLIFAFVCACVAGCRGASGPTGAIPAAPEAFSQPPAAMKLSPDTNVNELPEPPVVKAVNGVARVSLIADINPATGLPGFEYEGIHGIAPTIEVEPGQRFVVDITDDLLATGGLASDMNLHFHGLGSAPRKPGDDVKAGAKASLRSARPAHSRAGPLLVPSARAWRDQLPSWRRRHVGRDRRAGDRKTLARAC